mgnify:CR=1 FL=1
MDRFLGFIIKKWRRVYFTPKRALYLSILIIILFVLINLHVLITFGLVEYVNGTRYVRCFTNNNPRTLIILKWNLVFKNDPFQFNLIFLIFEIIYKNLDIFNTLFIRAIYSDYNC